MRRRVEQPVQETTKQEAVALECRPQTPYEEVDCKLKLPGFVVAMFMDWRKQTGDPDQVCISRNKK